MDKNLLSLVLALYSSTAYPACVAV